MATKTKEQIKAYLNQCGQLDYGEFIDFIDSVLFDDGVNDIAPICQVSRYRRYREHNSEIFIPDLFDEDNNLVSIYVTRLSEEPFSLNVGTTSGGSEITTHEIDEGQVSIDCTYLFNTPTPVYISGLSPDNIATVVVVYNSFECDDNGEISVSLLEEIQDSIAELQLELAQTSNDLQSQINTLSNSLIQIPVGIVVQWTGVLADIPAGWQRYTGNGSWFLIGESSQYPVGTTGGEKEVQLEAKHLPRFRLEMDIPMDKKGGSSGANVLSSENRLGLKKHYTNYIGNDIKHNNMPPYKAVIYIEKI